jgi:PIN domain nuclease of toxin-antitoxin system
VLLDANALLALLYGEAAADEVAALLWGRDCATPSTCLAEVVDRLVRRDRIPPEDVAERLDPLIGATLGIAPVENMVGWQAGEFRGVHYSRSGADLSLADAVLLACVGVEDELASSDSDLVAVALNLGLAVIPLPNSKGLRPLADEAR